MKKFAVIENGVVTNIAIAEDSHALQMGWVECEGVEMGWLYENGTFTKPPVNTTELANSARVVRNEFLKQCDWTQVSDAPVDKQAWATYRQALRDISSQEGFPITINWPVQP